MKNKLIKWINISLLKAIFKGINAFFVTYLKLKRMKNY